MNFCVDLGIPGIEVLPSIRTNPGQWEALINRLNQRPFLHSDGLSTVLGPPHIISGTLLSNFRELVSQFNEFYCGVIEEYYRHPERRGEYLINPLFESALIADKAKTPLPLSRLDCVLTEDGELRVIELNSIGVCTLHLQWTKYLARGMAREGMEEAKQVDSLYEMMVDEFERFYQSECSRPNPTPTIGILTLPNSSRGSRVMWKHLFTKRGWRYVEGQVANVEISPQALCVRGTPVDVLWGDWLFYFGYQSIRYRETKWSSRVTDFSGAPKDTAMVLQNPIALELFQEGRVVNIVPARSYLAISKHLLSWIHRADRPVPENSRSWLQQHVARTWAADDRVGGTISVDEVVNKRKELILKPCQYGGAHGVLIGQSTSDTEWKQRVEETWKDPGWILQEFYLPKRAPTGEYISFGLYNYGGQLGGITIRTAPSLVVSARKSVFVPVVMAT